MTWMLVGSAAAGAVAPASLHGRRRLHVLWKWRLMNGIALAALSALAGSV